jgi:hypothetical protein
MSFEFRWIMGSIAAIVVFGAGLLIYGIIQSNAPVAGQKRTIDSGEGAILKFDKWECMKGLDARGNPYQYARNTRNGATGPYELCKKVLEE